ncbi:dihydrolipoamide acetyltransferase family protein [Streptomyces sparsogenes]|uniref:dihydrolipoamide acetyltransferase family protein n=1 Tax=Streptomyces sparsogenes TaxID=67365 RepID=UPI0033DF9F6B
MTQAREFPLPDLGEGLTGAEIVRWLVEVGDMVTVDQPVVEVETAKASVELPCPYAGRVAARYGAPGEEIPVGAPLLAVGPPDDGGDRTHPDAMAPADGSGRVLVGYGTTTATTTAPASRRRRPAHGTATAPDGPAPDSPAATARTTRPGTDPVPVISPLVRRLAREHGLALQDITGSGPNGLVLRADVERAARAARSADAARRDDEGHGSHAPGGARRPRTPLIRPTATPAEETRVPLRGALAAMADKLTRGRTEIPDATCWVDADATALMAARHRTGLPLLALLARICVGALARHPELNATVDTEAREIVRLPAVHLGFAAHTDRGLLVPVVRDAHTLTARRLGEELARLAAEARAGSLTPADLTGGTFTLNNYGVFGVDGATPILNHPEGAMLGVGRIVRKPWCHEGELALRDVVQLSLTFDHRLCDGGAAGGFLRYVADCVEQPITLLADV